VILGPEHPGKSARDLYKIFFLWQAVPIPTSAIPTTRPIMRTVVSFDREFPPIRRTPDSAECGRVRLRVRVRVRELSE